MLDISLCLDLGKGGGKYGIVQREYLSGLRVDQHAVDASCRIERLEDFPVDGELGTVRERYARNRLRRRLREAIRRELWRLEGPWDLVFHPRRSAGSTPLPMLRREVERILAKCGTLS